MTLPPTDKPTIGWRRVTIAGRYAKAVCVVCRRRTRSGVAALSHSDPSMPDFRLMCDGCYRSIMEEGVDPGES